MYTLTKSEMDVIDAAQPLLLEIPGTEVLGVVFRTDSSFVQAVVPRPLRPAKDPTGQVMVTRYPTTSLGFGFNEAAVSVAVDYRGETGQYLLTMLLDDDIPLIAGRETAGNPKKLAEQISLTRDQDTVAGSVVRKGHEIITVEAELTGDADPADLGETTTGLHGQQAYKSVMFSFKWFFTPDGRSVDYLPRVVREAMLARPKELFTATGTLNLTSSQLDPVGEIPIRDIVRCTYGTLDVVGLPGKVVGRAWNVRSFFRHALIRQDEIASLLDLGDLPRHDRRERRQLRKAIRQY